MVYDSNKYIISYHLNLYLPVELSVGTVLEYVKDLHSLLHVPEFSAVPDFAAALLL